MNMAFYLYAKLVTSRIKSGPKSDFGWRDFRDDCTRMAKVARVAADIFRESEDPDLCEDEGCPNAGTAHVCISQPCDSRNVLWEQAKGRGDRMSHEKFYFDRSVFMKDGKPYIVGIGPDQKIYIDFGGQVYIDGELLEGVYLQEVNNE